MFSYNYFFTIKNNKIYLQLTSKFVFKRFKNINMTTKLSHPYKDHSEPWKWPKEREDEIEELFQWYGKNQISFAFKSKKHSCFFRMIKQPRFPKMTKNHVHQFYHACIYDKEETKKAFNRYVEVRTYCIVIIKKSLVLKIFSSEHQLQIVLASAIRFCPKFNLFITQRKFFFFFCKSYKY